MKITLGPIRISLRYRIRYQKQKKSDGQCEQTVKAFSREALAFVSTSVIVSNIIYQSNCDAEAKSGHTRFAFGSQRVKLAKYFWRRRNENIAYEVSFKVFSH